MPAVQDCGAVIMRQALRTPTAIFGAPPIAAVLDPGRIMPVPLMLKPFVVATATVGAPSLRLPGVAPENEPSAGTLPFGCSAPESWVTAPVASGTESLFVSRPETVPFGTIATPNALRRSPALSLSTVAPTALRRGTPEERTEASPRRVLMCSCLKPFLAATSTFELLK
jgi:hypothetical protein